MLTILTDQISRRHSYTFDFIFKERGIPYTFTEDMGQFEKADEPKLNYSSMIPDGIRPCGLLREEGIRAIALDSGVFEGEECLSFDGQLDPVASVFFLLSRYEEYTSAERDEHGRFPFHASILYKYDWVQKVMCDRWSMAILRFLNVDEVVMSSPAIVPTFDIDNTYAYKLKDGKRRWLSTMKDITRFDRKRLVERKEVLSGGRDPYDTFGYIKSVASKFSGTKVFWLVGKLAEKDRNISIEHPDHQELIKDVDGVAQVNLHPSYASYKSAVKIVEEKESLEEITGKKILSSRQHFLRFSLPESFRLLEKIGFSHEYSMGFAEAAGFRSGTARPHRWFDLKQNRISDLVIHPFAYMDGTLNEYMELSTDQAKALVSELYGEVEEFGGDFVFIWHNETIGDYGKWKGWKSVLEHTLNLRNE